MTSDEVKDLVRETVRETLRQELGDTHVRKAQALFIADEMARRKRQDEMKQKIVTSLLGQVVLWLTIGLGVAVWSFFKGQITKP